MIDYGMEVKSFDYELSFHIPIRLINLKKASPLGSVGFEFKCFNHRFIFNNEDGIGFDCSKL
jgi:hypothetical protein